MSDLPEVKLRAMVNFPASVDGRTAIKVVKDGGNFFLDLDYDDIQTETTVPAEDMPDSYNLIWNQAKKAFHKVPFSLQATAGVASLGSQIGAIDIGDGLTMNGSTLEIIPTVPSFGGDIGTVLRGLGSTHLPYYGDSGFISTEDFGIKADGTDETAKLQEAVTAAAGKALRIKGFIHVSQRIDLPSNITIFGIDNKSDGIVAVSGVEFTIGLFYANNKSNIKIRNLLFEGNLIEPVAYSCGAISFQLDEDATADMIDFEVSGCYFTNFKQSFWIWLAIAAQTGAIQNMRNIRIFNNEILANPICAPTADKAGVNGNSFLGCFGNSLFDDGNYTGVIQNLIFCNNSAVGQGLSGMVAALFNVREVVVGYNVTKFMGNNTLPEDRSYTYLFYNSYPERTDPTNIVIIGNVGDGNHNNAVYLAGARNVAVVGNSFSKTQPSGLEPSLPHGAAIALNGVLDCVVSGNTLTDNLGGIAYVGISDRSSAVAITGNTIRSSINSSASQYAYGVMLSGWPDGDSSVTTVSGNSIRMTGTDACGVLMQGTQKFSHVNISGNAIDSSTRGITSTNEMQAASLVVSGNQITGTLNDHAIDLPTGASPVAMFNNYVDFSQVIAGSSSGVRVVSTNLTIDGLVMRGKVNAGEVLQLSGCEGSIKNISMPDCTAGVYAGSLGTAKPTFSAEVGAYVQNLTPSEAGSSSSKYVVDHWINLSGSTTWQDQRYLTGN